MPGTYIPGMNNRINCVQIVKERNAIVIGDRIAVTDSSQMRLVGLLGNDRCKKKKRYGFSRPPGFTHLG